MKIILSIALLSCFLATASQASVIDHSDIAGLTTFEDTNTNRVWLDMDNFFDTTATFGTTGNDMIAAAQTAGFTFAFRADVNELFSTLLLDAGQWQSYADVMGYGIPRSLIWGMYDDGVDDGSSPWAWSYINDTTWSFGGDTDQSTIQNSQQPSSIDMGIWAYCDNCSSVETVPEPSTAALMILGVLGLGAVRRRQKIS